MSLSREKAISDRSAAERNQSLAIGIGKEITVIFCLEYFYQIFEGVHTSRFTITQHVETKAQRRQTRRSNWK